MGLKLGYSMEFKGSEQDLLHFLKELHKDLEIFCIKTQENADFFASPFDFIYYNPIPKENKLPSEQKDLAHAMTCFNNPHCKDHYKIAKIGMGFEVYLGEGCENFYIAFSNINKQYTLWKSTFITTKTQFAKDFLSSHLLAIAILDILLKKGLILKVQDQGLFFETRDKQILLEQLEEWDSALGSAMDFLVLKTKDQIPLKSGLEERIKKDIFPHENEDEE